MHTPAACGPSNSMLQDRAWLSPHRLAHACANCACCMPPHVLQVLAPGRQQLRRTCSAMRPPSSSWTRTGTARCRAPTASASSCRCAHLFSQYCGRSVKLKDSNMVVTVTWSGCVSWFKGPAQGRNHTGIVWSGCKRKCAAARLGESGGRAAMHEEENESNKACMHSCTPYASLAGLVCPLAVLIRVPGV